MRYFLKIKLKVVSLPTDVPNFDFMKTKDSVWKTLSSEYIFRRPWLTVRRDDMELPNGNRIPEYYILEYPDWVNMIAITRDDRFIFVRQYRPGIVRRSMRNRRRFTAGLRTTRTAGRDRIWKRKLAGIHGTVAQSQYTYQRYLLFFSN